MQASLVRRARPTLGLLHNATPLPNKAAGLSRGSIQEPYPGDYLPKKAPIISFFNTLEGAAIFPHGTKNSPVLRPAHLRVQRFTTEKFYKWSFDLAVWLVALGAAGVWLVSLIPRVQDDFLQHVPVLGEYYKDKTPDSDKWL